MTDTEIGKTIEEVTEGQAGDLNENTVSAGDELMRILEAAAEAQEEKAPEETEPATKEGFSEWESFVRAKTNAPIVRAKQPVKAVKKLSIVQMQAMRNRRMRTYIGKQTTQHEQMVTMVAV